MRSIKTPTFEGLKKSIILVINWLQSNWTNILVCSLLVYLLVRKNITLQISLNNDYFTHLSKPLLSEDKPASKKGLVPLKIPKLTQDQNKISYVKRFAKVAQEEMHKYGIPASITLAQGILESNAGKSTLASKNNNHFGIKCFSKKCKKGHCSNFSDDSHKDFFRSYNTAWESYRAHSEFLSGKRYKHLLGETSYKTWALGLVKAGYATDQQYGKKLIRVIESMELYRYDQAT